MPTTNYAKEMQLTRSCPHSANALTKLITAMADTHNNCGKKTLFGADKGLKSYMKFEVRVRELLICMVMDGLLKRNAEDIECYNSLWAMISIAMEIWPNWQDAYSFANKYFIEKESEAVDRVGQLMKSI